MDHSILGSIFGPRILGNSHMSWGQNSLQGLPYKGIPYGSHAVLLEELRGCGYGVLDQSSTLPGFLKIRGLKWTQIYYDPCSRALWGLPK